MITRLGNCIARNLAASGVIPSEDIELYGYGFFLLLSNGLYLLFTIVLGTFLDILWQSILFYLFFSLLRRYAGGIHARTEWGCMLSTTASFTLSIIAIYSFNQTEHPAVAAVLLLTGCAIIFLFSPLDTPQKPLPINDRQRYQKISRYLVAAYMGLGVVSTVAGWAVLYPLTLAVTLSSILLLLGTLQVH